MYQLLNRGEYTGSSDTSNLPALEGGRAHRRNQPRGERPFEIAESLLLTPSDSVNLGTSHTDILVTAGMLIHLVEARLASHASSHKQDVMQHSLHFTDDLTLSGVRTRRLTGLSYEPIKRWYICFKRYIIMPMLSELPWAMWPFIAANGQLIKPFIMASPRPPKHDFVNIVMVCTLSHGYGILPLWPVRPPVLRVVRQPLDDLLLVDAALSINPNPFLKSSSTTSLR